MYPARVGPVSCCFPCRYRPKQSHIFHDFVPMIASLIVMLTILAAAVRADDIEIGTALIDRGKLVEGREYIERAYKKDPSEPRAKLAYARILSDAATAAELYKEVAAAGGAAPSTRALALFELGCYEYARADYGTAFSCFSKAQAMSGSTAYQHMAALSMYGKADYDKAQATWLAITSQRDDDTGRMALYHLGNTFCKQEKYDQALNCYTRAARERNEPWAAAALAGACMAATTLDNAEGSARLCGQFRELYPHAPETAEVNAFLADRESAPVAQRPDTGDFARAEQAVPEQTVPEQTDRESTPKHQRYALQVGAFRSYENAHRLRATMARDFARVTVKKVETGGSILHKVRVGSYLTQEDALEFGEKHLRRIGAKFRVVKE